MDRRDFLHLSGAAAASSAFPNDLLNEALRAMTGLGTQAGTPAPGPVPAGTHANAAVKITSEFMEDYTPGKPWGPSDFDIKNRGVGIATRSLRQQTPFVASDGTLLFFTYFGGNDSTGPDMPNTVSRIYPEPGAITGWNVQQTPLEPGFEMGRSHEGRAHGLIWEKSMGGMGPKHEGKFLLYGQTGVSIAQMQPGDGGLSEFAKNDPRTDYVVPLVFGTIPAGARYVPEWSPDSAVQRPQGQKSGFQLRDLFYQTVIYPIPDEVFALSQLGEKDYRSPPAEIFPLKGVGEGYYRCVVWDSLGRVYALTLTVDQSRSAFLVAERTFLGRSSRAILDFQGQVVQAPSEASEVSEAYGCCYVHEPVAGNVEVLIFDPKVGVISISGNYDPKGSSDAIWKSPHTSPLPGWSERSIYVNQQLQVEFEPNLSAAFGKSMKFFERPFSSQTMYFYTVGTWDAAASRLEIFLLGRDSSDAGLIAIWTTSRGLNGQWEELVPVDRGCVSVDIFNSSDASLLISKPATGFEILTRNDDGEWESDYIRIPSTDQQMLDTASYRVGINLSSGGVPMGGETVQLTVSTPTPAIVDQFVTNPADGPARVVPRHVALSSHRPTRTSTDANGVVWINVLLEDRLSFPTLYIDSPRFKDGRLKVELNRDIEEFFIALTPEKLTAATDPRTQQKLMKKPENVGPALEGVHKLMSYEREKESAAFERLETLPLDTDVLAYWVPNTNEHRAAPTRVKYHPDCCWSFHVNDGVVHYSDLTSEQATFALAGLHAANMGMSIFDDIWDGLSSIASCVWEGVVKVTGAVFDAVSKTLHIVFDGLDFVVSAVLDTIERVMDAVSILLDAAGFILGMAVNWVLEQLGFLFDWPKIKRRRSQMKHLLYAGAPAIQKIIPDPMIGATFLLGQVDTMHTWLMQYSSKGSAKSSWGSEISSTSLPGLFTLDGVSALPPVTWLMDKLRERLFNFQGGATFDFAEFAPPQAEAMKHLMLTSQSLNLSTDDMKTLVVSWVTNADLFSSSAFQPLLDLVLGKLDAVIQLIKGAIMAIGQMLHALWMHPEKLVAWLDSNLPVPFLNGFYRGLTGNDLSLLDVCCLMSSISTVATGVDIPDTHLGSNGVLEFGTGRGLQLAGYSDKPHLQLASLHSPELYWEGGDESPLAKAAGGFAIATMSLSAVTNGLDGMLIAIGADERYKRKDKTRTDALGKLNFAMSLSTGILHAIVAGELKTAESVDLVMRIVIPSLAVIGIAGGLYWCPIIDYGSFKDIPQKQGYTKNLLVDWFMNGVNIYSLVRAIQKGNDLEIARTTLTLTQSLMVTIVRAYSEEKGVFAPPLGPFVFGGVVTALAVSRVGIFAAEYDKMLSA